MSSSLESNPNVHVSSHPLVKHKISQLRDINTKPKEFRDLLCGITNLLMYEATKDFSLSDTEERTSPVSKYVGQEIKTSVALVPILRSGLGLVNSALELLPEAHVFHLGLFREESSLQPVEYYNKLPPNAAVDECIILDPMVATGGTARVAIGILKEWGATKITFVSVCGTISGVKDIISHHPDVTIYLGSLDNEVNNKGFAVPGVGDSGDRIHNTLF
ncbi:hypothetical protein H4219_003693 [Mycoemilia scoparia]|uniref:uracil phosphoribosyltransferase n=1 Tax=Mycoemilia scoparia TaxID=417184 RepID=A0A9W8A0L4_9FUNG|nr:hypothetical protein H4219_003693 [Mycoemilia scoparia]